MNPNVSHDFVNDFTVNTVAVSPTVWSTSASRPLKILPKAELSSADCSRTIKAITAAN
jgi:hypothetical protein